MEAAASDLSGPFAPFFLLESHTSRKGVKIYSEASNPQVAV
jgi:hypothetical protein